MIFDLFNKGCGVKKKKVTAKDIQENISRIQEAMNGVNAEKKRITTEMKKVDRETEDGKKKYEQLNAELMSAIETYDGLQNELEKEYGILKKYKDSKFFIQPKDAVIIAVLGGVSLFALALERENPKAIKLATFLLKLFPIKL